jgi:hypothetical protein
MPGDAIPLPGWHGGDGDAAYLDKNLRHLPVELSFDDSVTFMMLFERWFRAAVPAFLFWLFFFVIGLFNVNFDAVLGSSSSSSYQSGNGSSDVGATLIGIGVFGGFTLFMVMFLFSVYQEPVGEWRVLLADRAPAAMSVYSAVSGQLVARGLPIQYTSRHRFATGFSPVANRLVLRDGYYEAYVSVFPYGSSLYLGWTMWRSRRGFVLVGRFIADMLSGLVGQIDQVGLMLRTERPRAMREAVHSICREGLHVAVDQIEVPEQYGFPHGLPPIEPLPGQLGPPAPDALAPFPPQSFP